MSERGKIVRSSWKNADGLESESRSYSSSSQRQVSKGVHTTTTTSTSNGGGPHMTLYNTVIEEKIVIEQIDNSAAKLAEQLRLSIEEKYRHYSNNVQELLNWLKSIEKELGKQEPLREHLEELKHQISSLKFIHDDLWSHGDDVNSTYTQIRTLITESTTLSTQNVSTLEEYGNQLKTRYDRAENAADQLLRKATTAYEELSKYSTEKNVFRDWLKTSCQKLVEIEKKIASNTLKSPEKVREFVNDVVSHKAELRFLEMNANRFTETTQDYLQTLNDIRAKFRLPALRKKGSEVQDEFKEISNVYNDLLSRANKLFDSLDFQARQNEFQNKVEEAINWLKITTPKVQKLIDEPLRTKPKEAEDQLRRAKALSDDIFANRTLITAVRNSGDNLSRDLPANESAAILKTCKDIEERYEHLVTNVNSKLRELESGATLVNKIDDNLKQIRSILEREEDRLPSASLGNNSREAESIAQTLQSILRTLEDNTSLLDTTRSFINELLRKGQGNESLRAEFVSLQDRWSALDKTARDRLGFSDSIRKFYDLTQSLTTWLDSKEKSLNSVHGDALQQIQQLKSLKADFKNHAPKLAELTALGETLLRRGNLSASERSALEETLGTLNRRWNDILAQIDARRAQAEALLDARAEFDKNCNRLEEALRRISEDLDTLSHDRGKYRPEALLKQIRALEKALTAQAGPIASLETAGQNLIELLTDTASKTDVRNKLAGIHRLYDQCTKKLESLRRVVEAAERDAQDFNEACAGLQKWVDSNLPKFDSVAISADRVILKEQVSTYEKLISEVLSRKPEILKMQQRGNDFDSSVALQNLMQSWATLERDATATRSRLNKAYDLCLKYDKLYAPFYNWLVSASEKLESISLDSLKKSDLERMQRELTDLKKEVSRRSHEFSDIESAGQAFLTATDRDKEGVRAELRSLKDGWDLLQSALDKRLARIADLLEKMRAFNEHVASTRKTLDRCESELDVQSAGQAKLKAIAEELVQAEKRIDSIKREGDVLCRLGDEDGADTDHVTKSVDDLYSRLSSLRARLNSRADNLEAEQKAVAQCQEKLRDITSNLAALDSELDAMKGVGREIPLVQNQISNMADFKRRLREEQNEFDQLVRHIEQLALKGTDTVRLRPQVEELRKKFGTINAKAGHRASDLDATLKRLQDFYKAYKATDDELSGLLRKEQNLETVHGLEELKRREMAAVSKKLEELNLAGRNLIKSASAGVSTSTLESDLEKINEKWKLLNERVAEKKRMLESQHLKGKAFDDAITQFLASLKHLDSLVVEDGRVHGDLDTVKPLVAQHKKVEDQLNSRRLQLQSIQKSAADLLDSASTLEEKTKITNQVLHAKEAYEKIKSKVERRSQKLELALKDAEKLNSSVHSLLEWLAIAEKKKRGFPESIAGLDETSAMKMLEEQEKFLREMERKEVEKNETLEFAREILAKAHPNAVSTIKNWISSIESKWNDLWNWAKKQRSKLQDFLASMRESSELLKDLLAWIRRKEDILKRVDAKALPSDLDELLLLIREHNEYMEGVDERQGDVNLACGLRSGTTKRIVKASSPARSKSPSPTKDRSLLFPTIGPNFEKGAEPNAGGNAMVKVVWHKWKDVWTLSWDRQVRLERRYNELMRRFSWEDWKKRFLKFMNYNKDRIKELFTKLDRRNTGLLPRSKFIDAITNTAFPTTDNEMNEVANMFDNGNDDTDYIKFLAALRAEWAERKPLPESALINNEIQRQVSKCTCKQRFRVEQVAEGTYRFGESQKLRLVRILRSTVMVRVGGGWVTLEEFLTKNDPCRMKGRTNVELREQLNTPEGAAHIMAAFTAKRRGDREASKSHSPSPVRQPEKGIWKDRSTF